MKDFAEAKERQWCSSTQRRQTARSALRRLHLQRNEGAREDQGGDEGVVRHQRTGDDLGPDGEMISFVSAVLLFLAVESTLDLSFVELGM